MKYLVLGCLLLYIHSTIIIDDEMFEILHRPVCFDLKISSSLSYPVLSCPVLSCPVVLYPISRLSKDIAMTVQDCIWLLMDF